MVDYYSDTLDQTLYALSDPTRRAMLARIVENEITVGDLAKPFEISLAAISKHLQVLERANFITKKKIGRTITCKANLAPLSEVMDLLEDLGRYWNSQLDSLERFLASDINKKGDAHGQKKRTGTNTSSTPRRSSRKR